MIFDSTNLFSDAQAITGTAASTNTIDFGATDTPQHAVNAITRDVGKGSPIALRIQVVEDFNTLTSLNIAVQVDDNDSFSSATEVMEMEVLLADLVAGNVVLPAWVPRGVNERYMRLNYTVTGTDPTTGKITAGFVFANDERDV
jgi:hypothetical protein